MSAAPIRIGVALPTRQGGAFGGAKLEQAIDLAVRAEALGLDSVWAGESLLARPRAEPLTVLTAVAARTERVALGTGVLLAGLHAPVALAQRLATVDQIARGRLVVGTGIGVDLPATAYSRRVAGVPFEQRVGRLVETVRACRTLWNDRPEALRDDAPGRLTRYWDLGGVELATKPARPGGPPFYVGATVASDAALRRTGRLFDGWFPTAPDATRYGDGFAAIGRAAAEAGRSVVGAVYLSVSIDRDVAAAEARLARYLESYYALPFAVMRKVQGVCAGTVEQCADWLIGYVRAGATHLVLRSPDLATQLEPIARELAPIVRSAGAMRAA